MANIHESHKKCVICGKEFVTRKDWKLTCSPKCSKARYNQRQREKKQLSKKPNVCVVCGKSFIAHARRLTCSPKCAKIRETDLKRQSNAKNQEEYKSTFKIEQPVNKQKKNLAEEAHKLRMQRQREARELGLSYAQYIAQKGIKEI